MNKAITWARENKLALPGIAVNYACLVWEVLSPTKSDIPGLTLVATMAQAAAICFLSYHAGFDRGYAHNERMNKLYERYTTHVVGK